MAVEAAILALILLFQPFELEGKTQKSKVLILGAGAAGIGFANRLDEKGEKDFVILEAQSFIGGRMKDVKFGNLTIQEGANWIHGIGKGNAMYTLKQKYGLRAVRDDYNDLIIRDLKGRVLSEGKAAWTRLRTKIDEVYALVEKMEKNKESDIPLKTALEIVGWKPKLPLDKALDFYLNDFENEAPPKLLSARNVGFTGEGTDELVTDQRGYAYLLREQAKNFNGKIHLDTVVKKIRYDDKKVTVETKSGTTFEADYAYVTFSTGILARSDVVFDPPLPAWKMKAVYMLPMNHYTKIFLKFPTKFWDNNRYILIANEKRGHYVHFMNLDRPGLFPDQKILLATVTDVESERVERLTDAQVKSEVHEILRQAYANATQPSGIHVSRWSLDNTTYGAYTSPVVGSDKYSFMHLKAPVNKSLWFGGEGATDSDNFGYAHGAYASAAAQADQLMACMTNALKCPVYMPRKSPKKCSSSVRNKFSLALICLSLLFSTFL